MRDVISPTTEYSHLTFSLVQLQIEQHTPANHLIKAVLQYLMVRWAADLPSQFQVTCINWVVYVECCNKSWTYMKKSTGPRWLPWGAPEVTVHLDDKTSCTRTWRPAGQIWGKSAQWISRKSVFSHFSLGLKLSKARLKSRYIASTVRPFSMLALQMTRSPQG